MVRVNVVFRELGRIKPDYSLDFDLPEVPAVGSYLSIQRANKREPYGEDVIVRKVWWRLDHPDTRTSHGAEDALVGSLREIFVECEPAISPYSSDRWRDMLESARDRGIVVEDFEVERFSIREDAFDKPSEA